MSNEIWVGVDVSKRTFHAAIAAHDDGTRNWARLPQRPFANTTQGRKAFIDWVRAQTGRTRVHGVCLESTGRLGWNLLDALGQELGPMAMINPLRSKRFGESLGLRDKTDRVDACVLAMYGATTRPRPTALPAPVLRDLRECNRAFSALSVDRQAYKQRLQDGPSCSMVRQQFQRTVTLLTNRMTKLQAHMDKLIESDVQLREDVNRLTSIKGVGRRSAYVLLAEFGDLRSYTRNELTACAGLFPRQVQSGTSVHKRPRLVKHGGHRVRKALYLCAMSACRHNPQLQRFYQRLIHHGKAPMAALGAVMRKLLILARTLLVHQTTYDPNYT